MQVLKLNIHYNDREAYQRLEVLIVNTMGEYRQENDKET